MARKSDEGRAQIFRKAPKADCAALPQTSQKETSRLPVFRSLEVKNFYIKKPKTYARIRLIERN